MTELKFFRLTLVLLGALVLLGGAGHAWLVHKERAAQIAIDTSFGEYNRYIAACGDAKEGVAWDLALRARATLERATAEHDFYADRADAVLWAVAIGAFVLVLAFYSLRWAMTGRLRPLWLLRR